MDQPVPTTAESRRAAKAAALTQAIEAAGLLQATEAGSEDQDARVTAEHAAIEAVEAIAQAFAKPDRATKDRITLAKADPTDVASYFVSTGLTRKELAAAAGVSTSVIATVQNEKGDRWSQVTFDAKRALIDQWMVDHADEIKVRQDADAALEQSRLAAIAVKAQRASAKSQPKSAPAPKASGKASGKKQPGRPSAAARQANRKSQPAQQVAASA